MAAPGLAYAHGQFILAYMLLPKEYGTKSTNLSLRLRAWDEGLGGWTGGEQILGVDSLGWKSPELLATSYGVLAAKDWWSSGADPNGAALMALIGPDAKPVAPLWIGTGGNKTLLRIQPLQVGDQLVGIATSGSGQQVDLAWVPISCPSTGKCASPAQCDDNNPCTSDACDFVSGCLHLPTAATCTDGNPCTLAETCLDGACTTPALCDDGDPCTTDVCDAGGTCSHQAQDLACNDGLPCTKDDQCKNGKCAGSTDDCNDGNACTNDLCSPTTGCVHTDKSAECDDSNPCTVDSCKATGASAGCQHTPAPANAVCVADCTLGYCAGAKCQAGSDSAWWRVGAGEDGNGDAVAATPDGGMVYGGYFWKELKQYALVSRVSPGGVVLWSSVSATQDSVVKAIVATQDGGALAVGATNAGGLASSAWLQGFDPAGKIQWTTQVPPAASYLAGAAPDGSGGLVAVGSLEKPDGSLTGYVVRVAGSGKLQWQLQAPAAPIAGHLRAVVAVSDGGFVSCGTATSSPSKLVLVRFGADGTLAWQKVVQGGAMGCSALAAVPGGFAVADYLDIVRLDMAGNVLWAAPLPPAPYGAEYNLFALAAERDGALILVGDRYEPDYYKHLSWFARLDSGGHFAQETLFGGDAYDQWHAVTAAPGGGYLLVGEGTSAKQSSGAVVARLDPWGQAECAASGNCANLAGNSCSDGNPCTVDSCSPKGGCQHVNLDWLPCGTGQVCDGGWCVPLP